MLRSPSTALHPTLSTTTLHTALSILHLVSIPSAIAARRSVRGTLVADSHLLIDLPRSSNPPIVQSNTSRPPPAHHISIPREMSDSRSQLLSALAHNDGEQIRALIATGVPIHDIASHHSHTPLQEAIALSNPDPLHVLLSAYFSSAHSVHVQERQLVVDVLVTHMNPTFIPSSSEHKVDDSNRLSSPSPVSLSSSSPSDVVGRVSRALAAIRRGEFVVVTDGADRENEGDLILDASYATASNIAYMVNETSGIICVGLSGKRAQTLQLQPMVQRNTESHQTAFTVTVDYNVGTTTGISAADRALTIRQLADDSATAEQFNRPGHVFPLIAKDGGVLERPGHTEASVEMSRLSGGKGVGVMCEVVRKDGSMMRPGELVEWSRRHGWEIIAIEDIIQYRRQTEGK